jgi:hypothetical protein
VGSEISETPREFLLDCARFYRGLGFFAKHASLSDEALADELERIRRDEWESHLDAKAIMDQLVLANWDKDRVWWEDAYEWLGDVGTMYADALRGWAQISRGTLRPSDIEESWETPDGPVRLDFSQDGKRYRLAPEAAGETLDINMLGPINALIAPSGMRFETVDTTDQTTYLLVVTPSEKSALAARGWPFEEWIPVTPPPPPAQAGHAARPDPSTKKRWFSR